MLEIGMRGAIGEIVFRVPIRRFETNLDAGVSDVSTLISFATLTCRKENHTLAERIRMAVCDCGAPLYFKLVENMRRVIVYIGLLNRDTYTTIDIEYTNDESTGKYNWIIPDSEDLYMRIIGDECIPSLGRRTSMYEAVGLYTTQSEGMCVRGVSQSIREQSGYPETCSDPIELDETV